MLGFLGALPFIIINSCIPVAIIPFTLGEHPELTLLHALCEHTGLTLAEHTDARSACGPADYLNY